MVMIIVSLVILYQSLLIQGTEQLNPAGGGFLPGIIAIVLIICGIVTLINDLKKQVVEKTDEQKEQAFSKSDYFLIFSYFIFIVFYVLSLSFLPFLISTTLFLIISIFLLKGIKWYTNVIVSIVTVTIIYFLFSQLFNIVFP
ncbi:tricarboxylate transport protein TctB [Geomicrobium sp. JCM 19038]|nr:tricarboxylate transport protein TctB [Geomicrobium sp. JCM 19038]